jgi:O-antigen/teichoic acid export membrane protein
MVLVLVVVLVAGLGLGVTGGLIATLAGSAVIVAGSVFVAARDAPPRLDLQVFRRMLGYGARVHLGWLFQVGNARLDVIILQFFVPLASVGHYFIAQIVAELVIVIAIAFQGSVLPLVARHEADGDDETTTTAVLHHAILSAVAVLVNAVAGSLLILYAFGPGFRQALLPMLIILPGMWFQGTGGVVTGVLRGRGRPGLSSVVAGIALVVTIALDLALIPPFGVVGAAVASLVTYTVFGSVSLVALSRVTGISIRTLVVPTRADLALYPRAIRGVLAQLRGRGTPAPRARG